MSNWEPIKEIGETTYICGYCQKSVGSNQGINYYRASLAPKRWIYICPICEQPTYFDENSKQFPQPAFGKPIEGIDLPEILDLFNEARNCMSVNAYTASVMCCRKLLMNIAVQKGAEKGMKFIEYVQYLSDNAYISPEGKGWVDSIRTKANEANHEIKLMQKEDAEQLLSFMDILLRHIYEFPSKIKTPPNKS